jgi:hypothetical protein
VYVLFCCLLWPLSSNYFWIKTSPGATRNFCCNKYKIRFKGKKITLRSIRRKYLVCNGGLAQPLVTVLSLNRLVQVLKRAKVVYVTRNPRDVIGSFYNHWRIMDGYTVRLLCFLTVQPEVRAQNFFNINGG